MSQPGVGQEAAWVGGCQSPPLQRGATATCSAAQEMLNLTQHLQSNRGAGTSEGGTLPQSHPPLHPPRCSHVAALGPTAAPMTGPRHPKPPPAPWPWGTPAVGLSKLLNPRFSSTQHLSPGPGFLGAQPPRGMPAVRLFPASSQLWHSASMQISASRLPLRRAPGTAWLAVRWHGCTCTQLRTGPPAAILRAQPARVAQLGKEKLEPYICPGQLSNVKHRTSPASVLLAAPAPRGKVLPARQSWDGLARSRMLPSLPALPSAPQPSGLGEPQGTYPAAVIAAVSMPHAPQGCSLLPQGSP